MSKLIIKKQLFVIFLLVLFFRFDTIFGLNNTIENEEFIYGVFKSGYESAKLLDEIALFEDFEYLLEQENIDDLKTYALAIINYLNKPIIGPISHLKDIYEAEGIEYSEFEHEIYNYLEVALMGLAIVELTFQYDLSLNLDNIDYLKYLEEEDLFQLAYLLADYYIFFTEAFYQGTVDSVMNSHIFTKNQIIISYDYKNNLIPDIKNKLRNRRKGAL